MKAFFLSLTILFLSVPAAYGMVYYDLNPSGYKTGTLALSVSPEAQLLFQPQNDFLDAVDFWVDNSGSSAGVTFNLRTDYGTLLSSKTVYVSAIAPSSGGARLHVPLGHVAVQNTRVYYLEATTTDPGFRMYYVDRIEILQHTTQAISPYITGVASTGGTEQNYVFKFDLYENSDAAAPVISSLTASQPDSGNVTLSFKVNEPIDYRIDYSSGGATSSTNMVGSYILCGDGTGYCTASFPVLSGTSYQYALIAKDSWGNQSVSAGNYATAVAPDSRATQTSTLSQPQAATAPPPSPAPDLNSNQNTSNTGSAPSAQISAKFSIGDRVWAVSPVNVRNGPHVASDLLGGHGIGSQGTVIGGPANFDGYNWWQINYDTEPKGWSVENYLEKISNPVSSPQSAQPMGNQQASGGSVPSSDLSPSLNISGRNIEIRWNAPASEPANGYRLDLFGESTKISRQLLLSAGTHGAQFNDLPDDTYRINIYANNGGNFEKIAEKTVSISPETKPAASSQGFGVAAWLIPILLVLILGGALIARKHLVTG